jgi:YD repeat-containing protein
VEEEARAYRQAFDGFDRLVQEIDPMGNVVQHRFDPNGNPLNTRMDGELLDVAGTAGNVRLQESRMEYDSMDRAVRQEAAFFVASTGMPLGDGWQTTTTAYSDNSQIIRVINDNGHQTSTVYDTANRAVRVTDHKGNSVVQTYDANSNLIEEVEMELSDLGGPPERFVTSYEYDNLDRLIRETDSAGHHIRLHLPGSLKEALSTLRPPPPFHENLKEAELGRCQGQLLAIHRYAVRILLKNERPNPENPPAGLPPTRLCPSEN